jgi:hypothetical protein
MITVSGRFLFNAIACLLLAGCVHAPAARDDAMAGSNGAGGVAMLPEHTGVAACDDYLSSYLACHQAAGIFPPGQLKSRYQAMRTILLHASQDPATRPQLAARCTLLATQLRQSLHGRSCEVVPTASPGGPP